MSIACLTGCDTDKHILKGEVHKSILSLNFLVYFLPVIENSNNHYYDLKFQIQIECIDRSSQCIQWRIKNFLYGVPVGWGQWLTVGPLHLCFSDSLFNQPLDPPLTMMVKFNYFELYKWQYPPLVNAKLFKYMYTM